MRLTTTATTLAALILGASVLGACGTQEKSGASDGYCQELKTDKAYFQSLDGTNPDLTKMDDVFDRMHSLAVSAPPDVAADWATLDDATATIKGALDEAGLDFADLAAMQDGVIPADVDLEKLAELTPKMDALRGGEVDAAAASIADHAEHTCGFELALD